MPIIRRYRRLSEAQLAAATLEGNGIPVELVDESTLQLNPLLNLAVGGVGIAVAQEHVAESLKILGVDPQKERLNAERHAQTFTRKVVTVAIAGVIAAVITFAILLYLRPAGKRETAPLVFIAAIWGGSTGLLWVMFEKPAKP